MKRKSLSAYYLIRHSARRMWSRRAIMGALLLIGSQCRAQTDLENMRNVVPPSPNASAIARYGEWPVSLYTGVPGISVPIYTVKGRSLSLPIALNYHAAGNKVGDIASWVGLGWSLSAGGVITRSVKGLPDDLDTYGYFAKRQLYSDPDNLNSSSSESVWKTHAYGAANNNADAEPDIYTLSIMGRSYRLLLKADGGILTMPHSNLKITTNAYSNSTTRSDVYWKVILEDGTVCMFGGSGAYETNTNPRFGTVLPSDPYTSSWYVKTIKSAVGETISFTYTSSTIDQDSYFSEWDQIQYSTSVGSISTCTHVTETSGAKAEKQAMSMLSPSTIETDLVRIDFIQGSDERLDLKGSKWLDRIKVYSKLKSSYIGSYQFNYSYSHATSSYENQAGIAAADTGYYRNRLKLISLEHRDADSGSVGEKWQFQYNSQTLPSRRSYAQDHWGFYNGSVSNVTLLPPYYYSFPNTYFTTNESGIGFFPSMHPLGANREGDETSMQAEILTSIIYPTGGNTSFNYEANNIPVTQANYRDTTRTVELHLTSTTSSYTQYAEIPFTLAKGQYVQFYMSSYISPGIYSDMPGATASAQIICVSGGCVNGTSISGSGSQWLNLREPGNYKIKVLTNVDQSSFGSTDAIDISATIVFKDSVGNISFNKPLGGLRVKSILSYDFESGTANSKKYFLYDSALVINPIDIATDYITEQDAENCTNHGASGIEQCLFHIIKRNSSTKFSLGDIQGGTVGYGKVTTLFGPSGEKGKTVSIFSSEPDVNTDLSRVYPYPASESREWRRGLLLKETKYTATGTPVEKTENTYSFSAIKSITAFKAGYSTLTTGVTSGGSPCACTDTYHYCNIQRVFYQVSTEQVKQITNTVTTYDGSNTLTNQTSFYYDNADNTKPTRTQTVNSKGDLVKLITRTALEKSDINAATSLSSSAATAIDTMVVRNMIDVPLQKETYINNILTNRSLLNFKNWSSSIVQPENAQAQKAGNPLDTRIQFSAYDASGNLLEQAKQNDVTQAYLYGYAGTYPIAQAVNALSGSIAATSFEYDAKGNWDYATGGSTSAYGAVSGVYAYTLSTGNVERTGLNAGKTYVITYWQKNSSGSTAINSGSGGTALLNKNGWTLYQREIQGVGTITVSGSATIDELRLYPKGAQMTTYTCDPLVGMTSQCDIDNRITYYEYDGFGRLVLVRDMDKNILKSYQYKYKEAQ